MDDYFEAAERHFGLACVGNGAAKSALAVWVEGVANARVRPA